MNTEQPTKGKIVKTLHATQNSEVDEAIRLARYVLIKGGLRRHDGEPMRNGVVNTKECFWADDVYGYTDSFEQLCEEFPDNVYDLAYIGKASFGSGLWVADENGNPKLISANYDSSD